MSGESFIPPYLDVLVRVVQDELYISELKHHTGLMIPLQYNAVEGCHMGFSS